jgi:predicted RNA-binding protein with PIN domain
VASGAVPAPPLDGRDFPLQALQRALAAGQACVLVVDGHNVLHLLPEWFRPHQDDHARIRRALADRLLGLAARHAALRVELWFDGPAHDTQALSDQVRLHFSGGTGRDRADHAIVAQVRHLTDAGDRRHVAVASADGQVSADVVALGALVVTPMELGMWW